MSGKTLWNIGWRYLWRHPWQSLLMILGIMLGVAVVVAIDLANASASRAFDLSTESIAGRATHQITAGSQGLSEDLYVELRRSELQIPVAPVISEYFVSPQLGNRPLQLLGVDPFAEAPFRDYLLFSGQQIENARPGLSVGDLTTFITQPAAVVMSTDLAQRYGLSACTLPGEPKTDEHSQSCQITIEIGGKAQTVYLTGLLEPADLLSRQALENLVLADISTVQEITGRAGSIDRIDIIFPETQSVGSASPEKKIQALLPPEANLQTVAARSGTVEEMTAAFRVNLTALSLLALVVGMFLIYNTMTFSVIQRRPLFGTLRALGVTRREVFALVIGEALIVGLLGAGLGTALGILLGQGAVRMVTQTINDLFFVLNVRGIQIPIMSLVKGAVLGVTATVLTAAPPAWEAASVTPRAALVRSGLESKAKRAVKLAAIIGLILVIFGGAALAVPTDSLVVSFSGTFAIIVGFAMLAPVTTGLLMRLFSPILGRLWGTLGRMAPRDVINSLSRTSIAVAALMVAVSVTIGVSLMVSSFRHTVVLWLEQTLQGDIYISAPSVASTQPSAVIDPQIISTLRTWPGVMRADVLRSATVDSPLGPVHIAATDNASLSGERIFASLQTQEDNIWSEMQSGSVLVSEPFANRHNLPHEDAIVTLNTDQGPRDFPVVAIYYDYASTQGTVMMSLDVYRQHWDDSALSAIALRLSPEVSAEQIVHELQDGLANEQRLLIRSNRVLREEVLAVFDRTFAITGALQLLATIVAFIGILSALLSLELERQRELGILRAVGLTVRQLWSLILIETGLMGSVAGLLAMPTGYILALILVFIINRRSFGWTLQMQLDALPFVQALLVAIIAALLAGLYPAYRIGRMTASEAIRSE